MIKKTNPFKKLDLVAHKPSGKRGIVTDVKGQMVTFEVIMPKPADGKIEIASFSFKHLVLVIPASMVVVGARQIQKQQNSIRGRMARWWKKVRKSVKG